jgi:hypothetical protein
VGPIQSRCSLTQKDLYEIGKVALQNDLLSQAINIFDMVDKLNWTEELQDLLTSAINLVRM